ncbi:transcriptional regulator [Roseomonas terrae]|uniref:Transcriptional regulator n=1 Tax=Neoroseomonas terrae TaxID=424799 RepID=A0ABS5EHC2_9PROT|nr:helix-turn-helix domain-containing protein [Neoroseomonas terrae]MBR0650360.1 transcriptional regulator [Neoroseomonas terrae]
MAIRRKDGTWQVAKLPSGDWHPEEIKAAVRMSGRAMSLQKLSRDSCLHPRACHRAIRTPHYWGELAIARQLRLKPADIWPSRHEADGTRHCQVREQRVSTVRPPEGHCESRVAA